MKLAALLWACALLLPTAHAETTIGLHVASAHESAGYNNDNPGLYAKLDSGITFGTYYNSVKRQTTYAGFTWEQSDGPFAVSLLVLTGYRDYPVIAPIPSVSIPLTAKASARMSLLVAPEKGSALHFSLEYKL